MKEYFKTPILFLIFNRPDTTQRVFDVIRQVKPKQLFIAADGPRIYKEGEAKKCEDTRNIIKQIDWDCEVKTLFRDENLGCGKAVSGAITWFFENVEEGIILEDDCLPALSFFEFCQEMLGKYRDDKNIGMISGSNYLFGFKDYPYSFYFSKHSYVWGWATWKSVWAKYKFNITNYPNKKFLVKYFDDRLSGEYFFNQFKDLIYNKIDTWDIQFTLMMVKNNLYSIIPILNQVSNIGITGTHSSGEVSRSINMPTHSIDYPIIYPPIVINDKYMDKLSVKNITTMVIDYYFLKRFIKKILGRKMILFLKNNIKKYVY